MLLHSWQVFRATRLESTQGVLSPRFLRPKLALKIAPALL
jgi:hypothetical protein